MGEVSPSPPVDIIVAWHGMAGKGLSWDGRRVRPAVPFDGCSRVGVLFLTLCQIRQRLDRFIACAGEMPRFFCCCRVVFSFKDAALVLWMYMYMCVCVCV